MQLTVKTATLAWGPCPGYAIPGPGYTWDYSLACYSVSAVLANPTNEPFHGGGFLQVRWVGASIDEEYGGASLDTVPSVPAGKSQRVTIHLQVDAATVPLLNLAIIEVPTGLERVTVLAEGMMPPVPVPPKGPFDEGLRMVFLDVRASESDGGIKVQISGSNGVKAIWFKAGVRIEVYNRTWRCSGSDCGYRETLLMTDHQSIELRDFTPDSQRGGAPVVALRLTPTGAIPDKGYHVVAYVQPTLRSCEFAADAYTRWGSSGPERDSATCVSAPKV
jgi:hypothetical protein